MIILLYCLCLILALPLLAMDEQLPRQTPPYKKWLAMYYQCPPSLGLFKVVPVDIALQQQLAELERKFGQEIRPARKGKLTKQEEANLAQGYDLHCDPENFEKRITRLQEKKEAWNAALKDFRKSYSMKIQEILIKEGKNLDQGVADVQWTFISCVPMPDNLKKQIQFARRAIDYLRQQTSQERERVYRASVGDKSAIRGPTNDWVPGLHSMSETRGIERGSGCCPRGYWVGSSKGYRPPFIEPNARLNYVRDLS